MKQSRTQDMVYIAVFAALITICSWIAIPATIPFTLQTLGIFLSVGLLGGRRGTLAVLTYILMAAVGLPVLAGFRGGIGALLGNTGGYVLGFLLAALLMWAMEKLPGNQIFLSALSMLLGLLICYAFGTAWFMLLYARTGQSAALGTVLATCVFPFILPDLLKIAGAVLLTRRLKKHIK